MSLSQILEKCELTGKFALPVTWVLERTKLGSLIVNY